MDITDRAKTHFRRLCAEFKKDPDTMLRCSRTITGAVWWTLPAKIKPSHLQIAMQCFDTKNELVDFLSCVAENRTQWPLPTAEQIASASGMTVESAAMIHTAMIVKRDRYLVKDQSLEDTPRPKKRKRADDDALPPPSKRSRHNDAPKPVRYRPSEVLAESREKSVLKQLSDIQTQLEECSKAVQALLARE